MTTGLSRVLLLAVLAACGGESDGADARRSRLRLTDVLGGGGTGYAQVHDVREFSFPDDHGPHPEFRSEWWYVSGNLETAAGRRFGYHVSFFRAATAPVDARPASASAWRTRQVWMAHVALADVAAGRELAGERFARGALGLAGARAEPFSVHVEDWSLRSVDAASWSPLRLHVVHEGTAIELVLRAQKPVVLQGDRGLSRKSARPGNASYYYSVTRMGATGTVTVDGVPLAVTGSGWLDREWSTTALDAGQVGWDWFALQLDDGRDLMFYRMRRDDGGIDAVSSGALIAADGTKRPLRAEEVAFGVRRTWTSPRSGGVYPVAWTVAVPGLDLSLEVDAAFDAQELDLSLRYWEGAVDVRGEQAGTPITGRGYLEMTGYAR